MRSKVFKRLLKIQALYQKIFERELTKVNGEINQYQQELKCIAPATDSFTEYTNQTYRSLLQKSLSDAKHLASKLELTHKEIKNQTRRFEIIQKNFENAERTLARKKESKLLEDHIFRGEYEEK